MACARVCTLASSTRTHYTVINSDLPRSCDLLTLRVARLPCRAVKGRDGAGDAWPRCRCSRSPRLVALLRTALCVCSSPTATRRLASHAICDQSPRALHANATPSSRGSPFLLSPLCSWRSLLSVLRRTMWTCCGATAVASRISAHERARHCARIPGSMPLPLSGRSCLLVVPFLCVARRSPAAVYKCTCASTVRAYGDQRSGAQLSDSILEPAFAHCSLVFSARIAVDCLLAPILLDSAAAALHRWLSGARTRTRTRFRDSTEAVGAHAHSSDRSHARRGSTQWSAERDSLRPSAR